MIIYKLFALILLLIILIRLKLHLGLSLAIVSLITVILFRLSFSTVVTSLKLTFLQDTNIVLYLSIIGITFIGTLMSDRGMFKETLSIIRKMGSDPRLGLMAIPSIIGMVPMPGGALVSAPLVNEGGEEISLPSHRKHCINYIYRHMWEFMLPIYPAILLIYSTFKISLSIIVLKQFIYTVLFAAIGFFVCFQGFSRKTIEIKHTIDTHMNSQIHLNELKHKKKKLLFQYSSLIFMLFKSIWPLIAIITGIISGILPNQYILVIILIVFAVVYKTKISDMVKSFKKSFSFSNMLIVMIVIFFKTLIQQSNVFKSFPDELAYYKISPVIIAFFLPLCVSFLTGLMLSGVGVSFSILYPLYFLFPNSVNYKLIMISYVGSFIGIMISPTHLCFSLTKDYFKAEYKDIFKILVLILGIFLIVCIGLFVIGYPTI